MRMEDARSSADELADFTVGGNGRFIDVSDQMLDLFGYEERELLGERIERLFDAESVERLMGSGRGAQRVRTRGVRKDGSSLRIDLQSSGKGSEDVRLLHLRGARNEPSKTEAADRAIIEERFRSAFHFAAVGMALVAVHGKLEEVNYAFCEIFGLQVQEAAGSDVRSLLHPEDVNGYLDACTRLLIGELQSCETEKRFLHASGRLIWGAVCLTLVRDVEGRPIHYILQVQDVTQRKETEELLRKSDKLTVVGQLAAGVAHEVRNPLTVLKGFAQMLRSTDEDNRYFDLMLSEVERIEAIIREFLMLAKPQMVRYYEEDLNVLVNEVAKLMETKAVMSGVQIVVRSGGSPRPIQCDANQIKQVLVNLMQNAIEAMPKGGCLRVDVGGDEQFVKVAVRDEGCGIPEDRLTKLGEPFYSSKEKGTGLGLMISYQIIQKHRGTVKVTSKLDVGTTFEIAFPASRQHSF
ncbi:PAS domain S-box protein [Paenibacillus sp.]|uniref:PAS domain S-box protein n=1 Tax=Paenibacillus sp. TaxID=58172 RepID=UPI002D4C0AEC|nr:PAS domain S-box protein [Paenibacillus sp.]HZG55150.1 PAS domain S-box protein [Paenibacillus sp.]